MDMYRKIEVGQFRRTFYGIYEVLAYAGKDRFKIMWHTTADLMRDGTGVIEETPVDEIGKVLQVPCSMISDHMVLDVIEVKREMPRFAND